MGYLRCRDSWPGDKPAVIANLREESRMLTNVQLEEIEAKAGRDCKRFIGKGGTWEIVVKAPTEAEWEFYLNRREQPLYKTGALKELLGKIVVYPDYAAF